MIPTWWRRWTQQLTRSRPRAKPARYRPEFTVLETRSVPAVVGSINFPGLASSGLEDRPNESVAVGPDQVVEVANTNIAIYDKASKAVLAQTSLANFFGPIRGASASGTISDPIALFDELSGRFIVAALDVSDRDQRGFLDIAVSNSSNANGGFTEIFRLETTEALDNGTLLWGNDVRIGKNADAIVFTFNMFTFPTTSSQFDHVQVVTLDKSTLLDRDPSTQRIFRFDRPAADFGLAPADLHDPVAGGPVWLVGENNRDGKNLKVVRVDNALSSSPAVTDFLVPVPAYSAPPPPLQPGGNSPDLTIDSRIQNAAGRGGSLVAGQNIGVTGRAIARWYQIYIRGAAPALVQAGDIDRGPGVNTYYPAIDVAPNGDIGMTFIESSAREYLSMYITGRKPNDAINFMQKPLLIKAGEAIYRSNRVGGHSSISVDPGNFPNFWAASVFARDTNGGLNNWGTWVVNFLTDVTEAPGNGGTQGTAGQIQIGVSASQQFVAQLYVDLLGRQVDPSGLASWSAQVDAGVAREQGALAIETSREYLSLVVNDAYRTLLGRDADASGLNNFVNFLAAGGRPDEVQQALINSPEYAARNGGADNLTFVRSLYLNVLGRQADPQGEAHFTGVLNAGIPRSSVVQLIVTSPEAKTREVESFYQRFLRRAADPNGLNHFVSLLLRGAGLQQPIVTSDPTSGSNAPGALEQDVIAAIVGSAEYFTLATSA
jgi:Domain of unknown function (DUF4214)